MCCAARDKGFRQLRSPVDLGRLGNPLDFLLRDHIGKREICARLDRIAAARTVDPDLDADVMGFLGEALPLHHADETEDLFPLLRRRCTVEDEIREVIARLVADHARSEDDTPEVLAILRAHAARSSTLSEGEAALLVGYSERMRRHLVLENAIIMPFARLRLTGPDLDSLRLRMLQRRGLDKVWERSDDG